MFFDRINENLEKKNPIHFFLNYLKLQKKNLYKIDSQIKDWTENSINSVFLNTKVNKVSYIVSIKYTPVNTFLHVSDCYGKLYYEKSAGYYVKGKQKRARSLFLKKYMSQLLIDLPDILKKPIALHFVNVPSYIWLVKYLKKKMFITVIKKFDNYPHNGCRNKKIKRKKYKKKLTLKNEKKRRSG